MKQPKIRFKGFSGEWEKSTIGNISTSFSGGTPSVGVANYYGGSIPFIRSGEIAEDKTQLFLTEEGLNSSSARMVEKGTLLYALYGATSGEVGVSKIDGAINQAILAIIPKKGYSTTYLSHYLRGKKDIIVGALLQGGQGNLSGALVKEVEVNLPRTFEEQCAIANYLDHLDTLIQSTTKKIDSLKQVKAASLQSMFPQEGETTPRVRFKGFKGEWIKDTLGNIAQILKGEQINKNKLSSHGTYYVLNGGVEPSGYTENYNTKSGTISISEGGNSCGYVSYNNLNFWSGGHNYTLQNVNIDNKFLYAYLKGREHDIMSKRVGSGLPNIQKKSLQDFIVFFPFNGDEQHLLGLFFFSLDTQISLHSQRLEKLKQIKSACLDNMFV